MQRVHDGIEFVGFTFRNRRIAVFHNTKRWRRGMVCASEGITHRGVQSGISAVKPVKEFLVRT